MWRLPGLLGRALPRLLGPDLRGVTSKSTSPDGPQATSSNLLVPVPSFDRSGHHGPGTSKGPRSHGWKAAFQWMSAHDSRNTLWDAISWGTLAVLALQLARQIHFQASLPAGPRRAERCFWHSPLDRFLSSPLRHPCSSLRRHILPSPDSPAPRHTGLRELGLGQEEPSTRPESLSSRSSLRATGLQGASEEDPSDAGFLHASSSFKSKAKPAQPQPTGEKQEQDKSKSLSLEEAMTSIQQLFQLSVSIAFNFLGTENMRDGDYMAGFSYFQKAADHGYSKAQYNVGLCHEHGRGTPRDLGKAAFYYQLAASQGHNLAQYRYARCLLQDPASSWDPEQQRAVSMLKHAADSGLREAQAFLGVLFTKEAYLDEQRAVKYLWLAANNGMRKLRHRDTEYDARGYTAGFTEQVPLGNLLREGPWCAEESGRGCEMLPAVSSSGECARPGEAADPLFRGGSSPGAQRPGSERIEVVFQPLPLQPEHLAGRSLAPAACLEHREPWPPL
ncbi:death ligand signal enhancer isoform X2 [Mesoplodon densirostris]|uniref:death ligand signal enhancer isoform X2 n=1 Tax=Mesoplodon densirostris TaxID=48708 RepID=UPI0028DB8FA7|nr:death ligand signal enhancer isoform X2 [Mesoplodon densirostris]